MALRNSRGTDNLSWPNSRKVRKSSLSVSKRHRRSSTENTYSIFPIAATFLRLKEEKKHVQSNRTIKDVGIGGYLSRTKK